MDDEAEVFRALAPLLRVRPELQQICRFGLQFASPHGPEEGGWAPFHIVTHGSCVLDAGERTGIRLEAGDVAVLPHGGPHTVRALAHRVRRDGEAKGYAMLPPVRVTPRRCDALVVKSNVEGDPDTKLICGRLRFEHVNDNMVLAALPPVVVLTDAAGRDAARARRIVDTIQAELDEDRPGAAAIAGELASSLMMIVLRAHFENERKGEGILALLGRRQTARALAAMLSEPACEWTLDGLAEHAGTSRATLVRLFQKAAGAAPLAFLAELRLGLARQRLRATATPLAVIAEEVGYQSETAFSRAYHRRFGLAPGADRKDAAAMGAG